MGNNATFHNNFLSGAPERVINIAGNYYASPEALEKPKKKRRSQEPDKAPKKTGSASPDVFISYHEKSAGTLAQQIAEALEKAGISCWVARRDMPAGGNFANEISLQIKACKLFLLLLNQEASQSKHVANELTLAFGRFNKREDIQIIPLKIGEFQEPDWVHYFLSLIQSAPFSAQPDAQELEKLTRRVQELTQGLNASAPLKLTPPKVIDKGDCGDCGNNVTYKLYENGLMVISGSGPMQNCDEYEPRWDVPWMPEDIREARIEEGVTSVGSFIFKHCKNLESVSLPDSVTDIGGGAFYHCVSLRRVNIPENVHIIQMYAFTECESLESVRIPAMVGWICDSAFEDCENLKRLEIADRLPSGEEIDLEIDKNAFRGCESLESVGIPDRVKVIGSGAFVGCENLEQVRVRRSMERSPDAFDENTEIIYRD